MEHYSGQDAFALAFFGLDIVTTIIAAVAITVILFIVAKAFFSQGNTDYRQTNPRSVLNGGTMTRTTKYSVHNRNNR